MPPSGTKHDAGKRRYDLMPEGAFRKIVDVLTYGAAKYGEENWREVEDAKRRYYAAAMRHMEAWRAGCVTDEESGYEHLAHAVCSLLFLIES